MGGKVKDKGEKKGPHVFGIRHLSPAGAYYVRRFLDEISPELVLIEGPSDFTELIGDLKDPEVKPPVAVMAYTEELPVRTILYPFAVYSPEYQAILWAREHGCECRFCDLPSQVFLGIEEQRRSREQRKLMCMEQPGEEAGDPKESPTAYVYRRLGECSGDGDQETFWERTLEHASDEKGYERGAAEFGRFLRELSMGDGEEDAENLVREAYMRRVIAQAEKEGFSSDKIAVVTGAFHVEGLLSGERPMTDKELKKLPKLDVKKTLMPYSYFRLSERAGYGAGNRAPAYYEFLWDGLCREIPDYTGRRYLAALAAYQREHGNMVSSAEIIEAVRLAGSLAELHGGHLPALRDLRDAAVTCMGHGSFSEIALAVADTEIGTKIGSLPEGVSQTSIQSDFYRQLKELRLEKYKSVSAQELSLDLREKLTVKSERAAFLDLERSFFLHRLRVLGIGFGSLQAVRQERATWAEQWILRWTPEAEMQIVEAVLKGDTVEQAASFELRERTLNTGIAGIAEVIEEACN